MYIEKKKKIEFFMEATAWYGLQSPLCSAADLIST